MLLDPSWEIPVLSIPPGTSSRCQQCWEGKKRSHPSLLAWLQKGEQGSSSPFPAPPGELRVSLHAPHRAADPKILQYYGKIKIKPKPVLLEQSWSQGLDKAQNFPSRKMQRGLSHLSSLQILGKGSTRAITPSLSSIPWLVPSPCQPLPALQSNSSSSRQG